MSYRFRNCDLSRRFICNIETFEGDKETRDIGCDLLVFKEISNGNLKQTNKIITWGYNNYATTRGKQSNRKKTEKRNRKRPT